MVCSRSKGANGELEFSKFLRERGVAARRSQQYCGVGGDADLVTDLPYHFEVKRVEALNIGKAMAQAISDSKDSGQVPVVAHRKNRAEWLVTMRAEDWLRTLTRPQPNETFTKDTQVVPNNKEVGE